MEQQLGERVARLEEQNKASFPIHEKFQGDIEELKEGQTEIKTTLRLLVTNGHQRTGKSRDVTVAGGAAALIAAAAGVLRYFGV